MKYSSSWQDFKVLRTGDGQKLEKWGNYTLLRPDPQVIWHANANLQHEKNLDAYYVRESTGGGRWEQKNKLPEQWQITWNNLKFIVKPMGFKHTGIFPEQAVNWEFMQGLIKKRRVKVLNLFAYTGCASVALASVGADVTHVDASKGMVERAKDNARINGISNIRFIVDDCRKFVEREIRRGNFYDAVIMDPPSYGRGTSGEMWKLEDNIADFLCLVKKVLINKPLFVLLNSYTTGLQPQVLVNLLVKTFQNQGKIFADEIGIKTEEEGIILPCGASGYVVNVHE